MLELPSVWMVMLLSCLFVCLFVVNVLICVYLCCVVLTGSLFCLCVRLGGKGGVHDSLS